MARIARVVIPGIPHHLTQRGNRRMQTFFSDDDYREYIALMTDSCRRYEVENHLLAAARYMELNPVRAGLAQEPWS